MTLPADHDPSTCEVCHRFRGGAVVLASYNWLYRAALAEIEHIRQARAVEARARFMATLADPQKCPCGCPPAGPDREGRGSRG